MKPVLTKQDFIRRYRENEFGNRAPTWNTVVDWANDPNGHGTGGWNGPRLFHLRNRQAGGKTYYNLTANELLQVLPRVKGDPVKDYYVSEMAPHQYNLLQGEVRRNEYYPDLIYSVAEGPMREALATETRYADGARAAEILRYALDPSSYDWLQYLFEEYEDHVIEFSTFTRYWGTIPRRNTVFWEVRKY